MALLLDDLSKVVSATIRQLSQSRADLLTNDQLGVRIEAVDFQVNLIAPDGLEALQISSITAMPTRISSTETPETVETSTQEVGAQVNQTQDRSTKEAVSNRESNTDQTQQYGRETISRTTHKD
jgi:hypothetical protein